MTRRVAIVGAGITGLSAAYYVEKRAREQAVDLSVTLIEAAPRGGGKVITDDVRGFVIEGGPDSFVTDKPWALALCHELGLGEHLIPCNTHHNKVYLLRKGRLHAYPEGFRLTIPTRLGPFIRTRLISWPGKCRMAAEYFLPARPRDEDESLGSFIGRRFGREAVEIFGGPLMAGIYVSDPDRLSMRGAFPTFLDMERNHGGLIRAARAMKRKPPPRRAGPAPAGNAIFNTLRDGMGRLAAALEERVAATRYYGCTVDGLSRSGSRWQLSISGARTEALEADDVVLATPAHRAAVLVSACDAELAGLLGGIRFVSTATVSLAFLREDVPAGCPADGFGVLLPARENRKVIACTYSSNKFKHRAPHDGVLLRVFVGGYRQEAVAELPEAELVEVVCREVAEVLGIHAPPILTRVYRWPKGNPQYDVGHVERVERMEAMAARIPGLHLAGSSYHGVGLPDCIKSALRAVDRILPDTAI